MVNQITVVFSVFAVFPKICNLKVRTYRIKF